MTVVVSQEVLQRLAFLVRVSRRESDHLQQTDRLGWLTSVDDWFAMRQLRNQMVHEYIEDPAVLAGAVNAGHQFVPALCAMAERLLAEIDHRFGVLASPASALSGNSTTVGGNP